MITFSGLIPVASLARNGGESVAVLFYTLSYFISGSTALALRDFEEPVPFVLGESIAFFMFTVVTAIILAITVT